VSVPGWYQLILLGLAAYRIFRLLGVDTITDRPRLWLVGLPRGWQEGDPIPDSYREELALFLQCPWCAGFWISALWWAAWLVWPHATLVAAGLFAISAIVGAAGHLLD
jgi:Protein of unknown function (DUF1360)